MPLLSSRSPGIARPAHRRGRSTRLVGWAGGSFVLLVGLSSALAGPGRGDHDAPSISVLAAAPTASSEVLRLAARMNDASGVGEATLWARGEHDENFIAFPMTSKGVGLFVAELPHWPGRGSRVAYYVEATDRRGNGPRRVGAPHSPYLARLNSEVAIAPGGTSLLWTEPRLRWGALALGLLVVGAPLLQRFRRRGARSELITAGLRPLDVMEGAVDREDAVVASDGTSALDPQQREVEDRFWLELVEPLLRLSVVELEGEIDRLCGFPHHHPLHGLRMVDRGALTARLDWARRLDPAAFLHETSPFVATTAHSPLRTHRASGMSLIEMLCVLTVLGVAVGMSMTYLQPMAAPLRTGGQAMEGLFRQSRVMAMASTSAYRVRALNDREIIVEHAPTCGAATWTSAPRQGLELPRDVTMTPTDWSVCFSSRGLASDNLVLTLQHPRTGDQQLEVMLGGTLRWLP